MKSVTIQVGDDDIKSLKDIFKNEASFKPQAPQDYLIINILKQVIHNSDFQNESGS